MSQAERHLAHAPIGVFDSGVGGLTIVEALKRHLPQEQILYYGDTAHLPYGDKSPEVLQEYAARITRFLLGQGVKLVVIACNTASAVAYATVAEQAGGLPVFEVITPAVERAVALSTSQRIGVIGTKTTIESHVYLQRILQRSPQAYVIEKATPLLVPLIEEGWLQHELATSVIEAYMSDTAFRHVDSLILGCTHYPLIQDHMQAYFARQPYREVAIVNSSDTTARAVQAHLQHDGLLATEAPGPDRFYVSDLTANFQAMAGRFFPGSEEGLTHYPLFGAHAVPAE
jgi:glutamate racemase